MRCSRSSTSADNARLLVVSGPSGAGKTTVVAELLRRDPSLYLSVSATTRAPRPGEVDGEHYRFLTTEAFEALVRAGGFLEWAEVHGARYGTPRDRVESALADGRSVVLEIDVQGARQVRASAPDAITVFIEPPSWDVLVSRLESRGTESPEALKRRLGTAEEEMEAASWFDHRVVNDQVEHAVSAIRRILDGTP